MLLGRPQKYSEGALLVSPRDTSRQAEILRRQRKVRALELFRAEQSRAEQTVTKPNHTKATNSGTSLQPSQLSNST